MNQSWPQKLVACVKRFDVLAVIGFLAVILLPRFPKDLELFSTDYHRGSVMYFSSLYQFSQSLIPVRDYFSQYGSGQGFVGQYLAADSIQRSMNNLLLFHVILRVFFYATIYMFLKNILGSRLFSIGILALVVACSISMNAGGDTGIWAIYPSVGPYRYFLVGCVLLCFRFLGDPNRKKRIRAVSVAGALSGISLFWCTDVGVAIAASAAAMFVAMGVSQRENWRQTFNLAAMYGLAFLLGFLVVGGAAYGSGFYSVAFIVNMFKYLALYMGGWSVMSNGYSHQALPIFINIVSPAVLVATAAALFVDSCRSGIRRHTPVIIFLCCLGLTLSMKYITRSYQSYWLYDSFPIWIVGGYWLRNGCTMKRWQSILAGCVVFVFCLVIRDELGNYYGIGAIRRNHYSLFSRGINKISPTLFPLGPLSKIASGMYLSSPEERAIIHTYFQPRSPALIVSKHDWIYYLETQTYPEYYMMPIRDNAWLNADIDRLRGVFSRVNVFLDDETDSQTQGFIYFYGGIIEKEFYLEKKIGRFNVYLRKKQ